MTRHKPHPRPKVLDVKRAKFEDGIERFIKKEPVKFFFWERPLSRTPCLDISGKVEKNRGYPDTTPIMAISMRETLIIHIFFWVYHGTSYSETDHHIHNDTPTSF